MTTCQKRFRWLTEGSSANPLGFLFCECRFALLLFGFGLLFGPLKRKNVWPNSWKTGNSRRIDPWKSTSTETLDKNKKTLILVFRCWHSKANGQSLRKSFEVMNEMFIFTSFCIWIKYLRCCFVFFVLEIAVFTCSTVSSKELFEIDSLTKGWKSKTSSTFVYL